jgi:hypothetical protein
MAPRLVQWEILIQAWAHLLHLSKCGIAHVQCQYWTGGLVLALGWHLKLAAGFSIVP